MIIHSDVTYRAKDLELVSRVSCTFLHDCNPTSARVERFGSFTRNNGHLNRVEVLPLLKSPQVFMYTKRRIRITENHQSFKNAKNIQLNRAFATARLARNFFQIFRLSDYGRGFDSLRCFLKRCR